jgi:hypothetical protein
MFSLRRQLVCECTCPPAVSERMNLDPHPVFPFIELERPSSTRHTKVPVTATGPPRKLALAADDETSSPALVKHVLSGEV